MIPKKFWFVWLILGLGCSQSGEVKKTNYEIKEGDFVAYSGLVAPSAKEYLALESTKMIRSFAGPTDTEFSKLPPSVDLASQLPTAGNQGKQNSCAGWALGFAVRSFQENRELGWGMSPNHLFSPSFLYNQLNDGKDEGVDLVDAMDFLLKNGAVPLSLMPYRDSDFISQPSEDLKKIAKGYSALGYRRIEEKNVQHIKAYLAAGEPVVIVIEMFDNFLPRGMKKSGNIYKEKGGKSLGYHALVAVGYEDAKGALKLLNSWGEGWGDAGYGWVAYDFAPEVIKQAYIIYDTPTSPVAVAAVDSGSKTKLAGLQEGHPHPDPLPSRERGPTGEPAKKVGKKVGAGMLEDTIMIVPDEGGITINDRWLRLASPLSEAQNFLSADTSSFFQDYDPATGDIKVLDDVLQNKTVAKIHFYKQDQITAATNQGVTFGSAREDVHRIYGNPDLAEKSDMEGERDTYFFHAITENWGGIKITKHASMELTYSGAGDVVFMALESVFKKSKIGVGLEKVSSEESEPTLRGTHVVSHDGRIQFTVPPQFTDIKKSVWEGTGYGYIIKNPASMYEFISFRVFESVNEVDKVLLNQRIEIDRKIYGFPAGEPLQETFSGITWFEVDQGTKRYYYGGEVKTLYQIQLSGSRNLSDMSWPQDFLNSVKILP